MSLILITPPYTHTHLTPWPTLNMASSASLHIGSASKASLPNLPVERLVLTSHFGFSGSAMLPFKTFSFLGFWGITLCWFSSLPRFFFSYVLYGVPILPPLPTSMSSRILALGFFSLTWDLFHTHCLNCGINAGSFWISQCPTRKAETTLSI